ncbi:MAG: filamentous hemagglutinin N-terminal domain-containing protein [Myxococcota bacterium]|nr:filamentous hemagglutinin N-terminal domain-containing protein [Myxococcota bacterium]
MLGGSGAASQGFSSATVSHIETDGSLGEARIIEPVQGAYTIEESLGRFVAGQEGNLFHSFLEFGLAGGDRAIFTATSSVDNVISRVTGGLPSLIDGPVESQISGARFFFLNPNGVIVGPNGTFELSNSLFLGSADRLIFEDGVFETGGQGDPGGGGGCCGGAPLEFGFDAGPSGEVSLDGSVLSLSSSPFVQLVGGDVRLEEGAKIISRGGEQHLAAVGEAATTVPIASLADAGLVTGPVVGGTIALTGTQDGTSDLSAQGGGASNGRVVLRGGRLILRRAIVRAGGSDGSDTAIDLAATESIELVDSKLTGSETAQMSDPAHVGVRVVASVISLASIEGSGGSRISSSSGIRSAGTVEINAHESLSLEGSGTAIHARIVNEDAGGDIEITAGELTLRDRASIYTEAKKLARVDPPTAPGGLIHIVAEEVSLEGGSGIRSTTLTTARSGDVHLDVNGALRVSDRSGITTQPLGTGDAGDIRIDAGSIDLEIGGQLKSEAELEFGAPGDITLVVGGAVRISGIYGTDTASLVQSLISTRVTNSGSLADAGDISIEAGSLEVSGGGLITARTLATEDIALGHAGNITLTANESFIRVTGRTPVLDDFGSRVASEISARGSAGAGGGIALSATTVEISDGAAISASTFGSSDSGSVAVAATDSISIIDGSIFTQAGSQDGGNITLDAPNLIELVNAELTTEVKSRDGGAGEIQIGQSLKPRLIVLNSSQLVTNAVAGEAGDITISADALIKSADTVVRAASDNEELNGEINIDALEQEFAGRLVPLDLAYLDVSSLLLPPCAARLESERSSLTVRGRPGVGADPGGVLPSPISWPGASSTAPLQDERTSGSAPQGPPVVASMASLEVGPRIFVSGEVGAANCLPGWARSAPLPSP